MRSASLTVPQIKTGVDRRIWWMVLLVGASREIGRDVPEMDLDRKRPEGLAEGLERLEMRQEVQPQQTLHGALWGQRVGDDLYFPDGRMRMGVVRCALRAMERCGVAFGEVVFRGNNQGGMGVAPRASIDLVSVRAVGEQATPRRGGRGFVHLLDGDQQPFAVVLSANLVNWHRLFHTKSIAHSMRAVK